jgi:hypothetical protein
MRGQDGAHCTPAAALQDHVIGQAAIFKPHEEDSKRTREERKESEFRHFGAKTLYSHGET